jgi:hypothetical protein
MPLLGGACKMSGSAVASPNPAFTGDPYTEAEAIRTGFASAILIDAGYTIEADGTIDAQSSIDGTTPGVGRWDNGLGTLTRSDYQFRFDSSQSPASSSDPFNTWVSGFLMQGFFIELGSFGSKSTIPPGGTIRVRKATSPFTEYDSADMDMLLIQEP